MKLTAFLLIYSVAISCISFSVMTFFGIDHNISLPFALVGIALANRVGQGFGITVFPDRKPDLNEHDARPTQGGEQEGLES